VKKRQSELLQSACFFFLQLVAGLSAAAGYFLFVVLVEVLVVLVLPAAPLMPVM